MLCFVWLRSDHILYLRFALVYVSDEASHLLSFLTQHLVYLIVELIAHVCFQDPYQPQVILKDRSLC